MSELRQHPRTAVSLHAKLRLDGGGVRFLTAVTENLSANGVMLHLINAGSGPRFHPGQRLHVGVAEHPRQAMLHADSFRAATVVRTTDFGHTTAIGVEFDTPQRMPMQSPRARAA